MLLVLAACGRFDFDAQPRTGDAAGDAADAASDALGPEQRANLSPAIVDPGDNFGASVAVSGDGLTIAVTAPSEDSGNNDPADNSATNAGAAYVFVRTGATWTQQAFLKQPAPLADVYFGSSLALSHDGSTLAVGGIGTNSSAGVVEVFTRSGTTWTHQATVAATVHDPSDIFGTSIGLSADGSSLAVGASLEDSAATGVDGNASDNSASSAGAAYAFHRSGTTWTQTAYLKASNTDAADQFGAQVAISGDGTMIAVSAIAEASASASNQADNSAGQAGAVYLFQHGASWSQVAYLKAPVPVAGDFFGDTLAFASNGAVLAAGAPGEDSIIPNSGAVYAMRVVGATVTFAPAIKSAMPANNDQLGSGLAIAGNATRIIGGAVFESSVVVQSGAAYRFDDAGGPWSQTEMFKSDAPSMTDAFGQAIGISDDGNTIALGAANDDTHGSDAGSVLVLFH